MRGYYFLFAALLASIQVFGQQYKYINNEKVLNTTRYREQLKSDANKQLVEIKKVIPGIALDIRYAGTNNFTHNRLYSQARAFARLPVAESLKLAEDQLKTMGLGLKVYDAYRPYAITVKFYEIARDTNFVADPRKGSRHNRGCAIDLTLINLKTGKELEMPTGFDSFSPRAAADYQNLPKKEIQNRQLLKTVMEKNGFKIYRTEWWHYDYLGWENYDLLDVPFSAL